MDRIKKIADKHNIPIIEDAAQAIGSRYRNIPSGKWGKVGCFSTHPLKNLNACGDGGFLVTDDDQIAASIRCLRSHGLIDRNQAVQFGFVSRMDAIQATILKYRIERLDEVIRKRRDNANLYRALINHTNVFLPKDQEVEFNTYHTFVIQVQNRESLRDYLAKFGVETSIHYPIPIHLQKAAHFLGHKEGSFPVTESQAHKILTLPIHQYLKPEQIAEIANLINNFNVIN
jgi:dTDP-4-amino-4,6-dideoxygalactose transaminase